MAPLFLFFFSPPVLNVDKEFCFSGLINSGYLKTALKKKKTLFFPLYAEADSEA